MIDHRDRAMEELKTAARFERCGLRNYADASRNKAALWFREAAQQTPWVEPQVAA